MVTPGSVQARLYLYSAMILPREGQATSDPYDTNTWEITSSSIQSNTTLKIHNLCHESEKWDTVTIITSYELYNRITMRY